MRSEAIVGRAKLLGLLFAVAFPLWALLDYLTLPLELFAYLAIGRLMATLGFMWLAYWPHSTHRLTHAHRALAVLFAVPTLFFAYSYAVLAQFDLEGTAGALAGGYALVPFALLSGIAMFPLTLIECLVFAVPMLAAQLFTIYWGWEGLYAPSVLSSIWLLLLLTGISTLSSVTQLGLMTALATQMLSDPLTGVFSRRSGESLLQMLFTTAQREDRPLALAFIDLDHFKRINDEFGHDTGDLVLGTAAAVMLKRLRGSDAVIRWGGEEFLLVMPDTSAAQAVSAINRLTADGLGFLPDGKMVTASIGIAERGASGAESPRELIELADQRMYAAKQAGRNRMFCGQNASKDEIGVAPRRENEIPPNVEGPAA